MKAINRMLYIDLWKDNEVFASCTFIKLEPFATSTARKFIFEGVTLKKNVKCEYRDRIIVSISSACEYGISKEIGLNEFSILLLDFQELVEDHWWAYGLVYHDIEREYRQGVIDIFNVWQKGKVFDWCSLPLSSPLKEDYLSACLYYSSVSVDIIDKDVYQIDVSLIREESDFLYLVSVEFFGERGYMGHSFYSFKDCLLELYNHRGFFPDKKIVFSNTKYLYDPEIADSYQEIRGEFAKYKFIIEEN